MKPWCVLSRDGLWCATFRNAKPDPDAFRDPTACGMAVLLRYDAEKRNPTCPDCKKRVARRRK